jgi:hypothetical protein
VTVYKRGLKWWADLSIGAQAISHFPQTSDRREARRPPPFCASEMRSFSCEICLIRRRSEVSASTIGLETDALKVKRHLGTSMLGSLTAESIRSCIQPRKAERIGNRTVNIEIGVLRRILKQFKLWHLVGEDYGPLPEP